MVALGGMVSGDAEEFYRSGINAVLSIVPGPISLRESMANAERLIADAAERALRLILINLKE